MILLETDRLIIKKPSLDDIENIYLLFSDPEVMRYVGSGVRTREETQQSIESMIKHCDKHGFTIGHVFKKDTQEFVGRGGLIYLELNDNQPDIEVGYTLLKKFWGQGYATEIATAFVKWGFKNLPVTKLIGVIRPENRASAHVLEKSGMHYVGKLHCYNSLADKFEITY